MKKLLKLVASVLMAVSCLVLLPGAEAMADESNNIVYAQVPQDWENPCVWAWDADGNSAFEAWPGEAMQADSANEGWYYLYVPKGMTSVIINANEGSVQTADLATNDADAWITVTSAEEATLTNDKLTDGDIPAYVETFTVYAKVDDTWQSPCLWAWSAPDGTNAFAAWPGEAMEANTDGWYSMKVPTWVNSIIVNANEGSVQTSDLSVEAKDVWISVDAEGNGEVAYEKPAASAEDMITVHAQVPSDWLLPCLWAWSAPDGTNVFPNWPGQELTLEGDWYTYSVPNWVNSIIINGNLGEVQTTDISVETGKDVWVVVKGAEDYSVTYEEPTATTEDSANADDVAGTDTTDAEGGLSTTTIVIVVIAILAVVAIVAGVVIAKKKNK